MYHIFIHSSVDGHMGRFHTLAIVNKSAGSTGVHVPLQIHVFIFFFGYIPRGGIVGPLGSSTFSFLRNLHILFLSDYTDLHSHQQFIRVPFSPQPHQPLLFYTHFTFGGSWKVPASRGCFQHHACGWCHLWVAPGSPGGPHAPQHWEELPVPPLYCMGTFKAPFKCL